MRITKVEIDHFDKEHLIFTTSRPTGLSDPTIAFGPVNYVHRYVIKTEDAINLLRFLLEAGHDDD